MNNGHASRVKGITPRRGRMFTLIEVTVILIMMGILALVAVPVYTKLTDQTADQATQSSLSATILAARAVASVNESGYQYPSGLEQDLSLPGNIVATTGASTSATLVSVYQISSSQLLLAAESSSGNCMFVYNTTGGLTTWGEATSGSCSAEDASNLTGSITGPMNSPSTVILP
jgi:type IV pilus assembly protein PilA